MTISAAVLALLAQPYDVRAEWRVNMADEVVMQRTVRTESRAQAATEERVVVEAQVAGRWWQRVREAPDVLHLRRIRYGVSELSVTGVGRRWVGGQAQGEEPFRQGASLAGSQFVVTYHRAGPQIEVEAGGPNEQDLAFFRGISREYEWAFYLPESPLAVGERYGLSQSRVEAIAGAYLRRAMEAGGGHFTLSGSRLTGSLFGQLESVTRGADGRLIATISFAGRLGIEGMVQIHNQEHTPLRAALTVDYRMLNLDVDVERRQLAGVRCDIDSQLLGWSENPASSLRQLEIRVTQQETTTLRANR